MNTLNSGNAGPCSSPWARGPLEIARLLVVILTAVFLGSAEAENYVQDQLDTHWTRANLHEMDWADHVNEDGHITDRNTWRGVRYDGDTCTDTLAEAYLQGGPTPKTENVANHETTPDDAWWERTAWRKFLAAPTAVRMDSLRRWETPPSTTAYRYLALAFCLRLSWVDRMLVLRASGVCATKVQTRTFLRTAVAILHLAKGTSSLLL